MDWKSLLVAAILSIPISIASNLFTEPVRDYLDKRRTIQLSKKKWKEVRTYLYVRALMEGDPAAKTLLDLEASFATRAAIYTAICFGAIGTITILAFEPRLQNYLVWLALAALIFGLFALFTHLAGSVSSWSEMQLRRKISRFHEYEDKIRERWGDDAITEFIAAQQKPPEGN